MTKDKPEDTPAAPTLADIKAEIKAMGAAYEALRDLDDESQRRAMRWLEERLGADRQRRHQAQPGYDDEAPF